MTSKARRYSMQFGRAHVFSLLEAKAMLVREQRSFSTAPNSPEVGVESYRDVEKLVPHVMASLDAVTA